MLDSRVIADGDGDRHVDDDGGDDDVLQAAPVKC
jgi:hypothetical protein